jgi:hypothetical protein
MQMDWRLKAGAIPTCNVHNTVDGGIPYKKQATPDTIHPTS